MTSLATLQSAIEKLDPNKILRGISYEITYNNDLGFNGSSDFYVPIPYNWPKDWESRPTHFESPLITALNEVLVNGASSIPDNGQMVFIDTAHLAGYHFDDFFYPKDPLGKKKPIIQTIADLINKVKPGDVEQLERRFTHLFWPDGKAVITHPTAKFCVGFYLPDFEIPGTRENATEVLTSQSSLVDIVKQMLENIHDISTEEIVDALLSGAAAGFSWKPEARIPNLSWNHAKIVAVNRKALVTGGCNYFNINADSHSNILDMQAKVKGDAAMTAHTYCDYLWRYLNTPHLTDNYSFRKSTSLHVGAPDWTDDTIPLAEYKSSATSGKPVLSVGKLGDWVGPMFKIEYPIQLIDAARGMILNAIWQYANGKGALAFLPGLWPLLYDGVRDGNGKLLALFDKAGVTPAAWASKIARHEAIANASTVVRLSIESIANSLLVTQPAWTALQQKINNYEGWTGDKEWDGYLCPFDLLDAMARFLEKNPTDINPRLYLLLSGSQATPEWESWEDPVPAREFKIRMKSLINVQLPADTDFDKWFDTRCKIRRVAKDDKNNYNHAKNVCVDDKLMYIGSDNPYPNYNEQHGVWIDDHTCIDSWLQDFWTRLWDQSTDAKMD